MASEKIITPAEFQDPIQTRISENKRLAIVILEIIGLYGGALDEQSWTMLRVSQAVVDNSDGHLFATIFSGHPLISLTVGITGLVRNLPFIAKRFHENQVNILIDFLEDFKKEYGEEEFRTHFGAANINTVLEEQFSEDLVKKEGNYFLEAKVKESAPKRRLRNWFKPEKVTDIHYQLTGPIAKFLGSGLSNVRDNNDDRIPYKNFTFDNIVAELFPNLNPVNQNSLDAILDMVSRELGVLNQNIVNNQKNPESLHDLIKQDWMQLGMMNDEDRKKFEQFENLIKIHDVNHIEKEKSLEIFGDMLKGLDATYIDKPTQAAFDKFIGKESDPKEKKQIPSELIEILRICRNYADADTAKRVCIQFARMLDPNFVSEGKELAEILKHLTNITKKLSNSEKEEEKTKYKNFLNFISGGKKEFIEKKLLPSIVQKIPPLLNSSQSADSGAKKVQDEKISRSMDIARNKSLKVLLGLLETKIKTNTNFNPQTIDHYRDLTAFAKMAPLFFTEEGRLNKDMTVGESREIFQAKLNQISKGDAAANFYLVMDDSAFLFWLGFMFFDLQNDDPDATHWPILSSALLVLLGLAAAIGKGMLRLYNYLKNVFTAKKTLKDETAPDLGNGQDVVWTDSKLKHRQLERLFIKTLYKIKHAEVKTELQKNPITLEKEKESELSNSSDIKTSETEKLLPNNTMPEEKPVIDKPGFFKRFATSFLSEFSGDIDEYIELLEEQIGVQKFDRTTTAMRDTARHGIKIAFIEWVASVGLVVVPKWAAPLWNGFKIFGKKAGEFLSSPWGSLIALLSFVVGAIGGSIYYLKVDTHKIDQKRAALEALYTSKRTKIDDFRRYRMENAAYRKRYKQEFDKSPIEIMDSLDARALRRLTLKGSRFFTIIKKLINRIALFIGCFGTGVLIWRLTFIVFFPMLCSFFDLFHVTVAVAVLGSILSAFSPVLLPVMAIVLAFGVVWGVLYTYRYIRDRKVAVAEEFLNDIENRLDIEINNWNLLRVQLGEIKPEDPDVDPNKNRDMIRVESQDSQASQEASDLIESARSSLSVGGGESSNPKHSETQPQCTHSDDQINEQPEHAPIQQEVISEVIKSISDASTSKNFQSMHLISNALSVKAYNNNDHTNEQLGRAPTQQELQVASELVKTNNGNQKNEQLGHPPTQQELQDAFKLMDSLCSFFSPQRRAPGHSCHEEVVVAQDASQTYADMSVTA